jgi:hypothetical protein
MRTNRRLLSVSASLFTGSGRRYFGDVLAAGDASGFLFVSLAADADGDGDATVAGAVDGDGEGDGSGTVSDSKAECDPLTPGNDSVKAINIKAIAAPIVTFASTFCVPRGPKAVLETLLVNRAPASALPGCSRMTTISTAQERINNPYKIYANKPILLRAVNSEPETVTSKSERLVNREP